MKARTPLSSSAEDDYTELVRAPIASCIRGDTLEEVADRLLFEKNQGEASNWFPYLNVLPKEFQDMPMFWDDQRLASVVSDGGQLERMMHSMKSDDSNKIDPWAMACAHSRCNFLPDQSYSLTPLLDMLNHQTTVPTRAKMISNKFDEDDQILALRTKQQVDKGDEVFISYGELTNVETLCRYGFVEKNNPANAEELSIRMINRLPLSVSVFSDGSIDVASKASLRQEMANEDESTRIKEDPLMALRPLSDRNEMDVMSFLASFMLEAVEVAEDGVVLCESDNLASTYLSERLTLLRRALKRIETKFPGIEY